eukprot:12115603-Heterocapsa_arctica.AAC.1
MTIRTTDPAGPRSPTGPSLGPARPEANAVEPARRSRRLEEDPVLPNIRRLVRGFRGHVFVEFGWICACLACNFVANSRSERSTLGIICSEQGELSHLVTGYLLGGAFDECISQGSLSMRSLAIMRGWQDRRVLGLIWPRIRRRGSTAAGETGDPAPAGTQ